jgi:hypothetical protein
MSTLLQTSCLLKLFIKREEEEGKLCVLLMKEFNGNFPLDDMTLELFANTCYSLPVASHTSILVFFRGEITFSSLRMPGPHTPTSKLCFPQIL